MLVRIEVRASLDPFGILPLPTNLLTTLLMLPLIILLIEVGVVSNNPNLFY